MIILLCVDDNMGMLFNKRRQSQDRILLDRILGMTAEKRLWMNQYSANIFVKENCPQIMIDEAFLENAQEEDYCFVENLDVAAYENKIEKIFLYHWNRTYPADTYFPIPLQENGWKLLESNEFCGYSHDKITEEVYVK